MPISNAPQKIQICENCRFWNRWDNVADEDGCVRGECRRYPPVVVFHDNFFKSFFPVTDRVDFCGEFSPKSRAKKTR